MFAGRDKIGKSAKHGRWKRRTEGIVMDMTEGEIEGTCLPGRRRQRG